MVCFGRPYHFKFFKGCLPEILLGPFLNDLTQLYYIKGSFRDISNAFSKVIFRNSSDRLFHNKEMIEIHWPHELKYF